MDPFLLTRIGDVTIQRVLPKQETPKNETSFNLQMTSGNPSGELDLSIKSRISSIDKRDDEGGGGADRHSNYSDASDEEEDLSEELDEDDEQDVPLSLVTNKRSSNESTNSGNHSYNILCNTEDILGSITDSKETNQVSRFGASGCAENSHINDNQNKCDGENKDLSDNDDDLPLSRLIADADNAGASFGEEEFDEDYSKHELREKSVSSCRIMLILLLLYVCFE